MVKLKIQIRMRSRFARFPLTSAGVLTHRMPNQI